MGDYELGLAAAGILEQNAALRARVEELDEGFCGMVYVLKRAYKMAKTGDGLTAAAYIKDALANVDIDVEVEVE